MSISKQERYNEGLEAKGLRSVRTVIPITSIQTLRDWAEEERQDLKEMTKSMGEQSRNMKKEMDAARDDIPCVDDERENPHKKNP